MDSTEILLYISLLINFITVPVFIIVCYFLYKIVKMGLGKHLRSTSAIVYKAYYKEKHGINVTDEEANREMSETINTNDFLKFLEEKSND